MGRPFRFACRARPCASHSPAVRSFSRRRRVGDGTASVRESQGCVRRAEDFLDQGYDAVLDLRGPVLVSSDLGQHAAWLADLRDPLWSARLLIEDPSAIREEPEPPFQEAKQAVDLSQAPRIVAVGRGIKAQEHLPLAVEIEADRMRGALIDAGDLESERTVILNEFDRGENDPMRKLYHAVWSSAFVAHPYHHPTIGWRSDIETVTPAGLRHFYDTFYWPNNATISVIGDVDRAEALTLVGRHFGGIPPSPEPIPELTTREPEQRGERRVCIRQAGQLGALLVAYKSPPALDEDTDALDVLAMVLASGKSSRLYRRLTDTGMTTHLFASVSRLRNPGLFYLYAMLAPGRTHGEVEAAIDAVVTSVKKNGVTDITEVLLGSDGLSFASSRKAADMDVTKKTHPLVFWRWQPCHPSVLHGPRNRCSRPRSRLPSARQ